MFALNRQLTCEQYHSYIVFVFYKLMFWGENKVVTAVIMKYLLHKQCIYLQKCIIQYFHLNYDHDHSCPPNCMSLYRLNSYSCHLQERTFIVFLAFASHTTAVSGALTPDYFKEFVSSRWGSVSIGIFSFMYPSSIPFFYL